jgi:hypothetical protein
VLCFVGQRARAEEVTQALNDAGFRAVAIHGDMDQVRVSCVGLPVGFPVPQMLQVWFYRVVKFSLTVLCGPTGQGCWGDSDDGSCVAIHGGRDQVHVHLPVGFLVQ